MVIISLSEFLSYSLHFGSQQIHLFFPFRKYNFKYKEENNHGDATRNQRYQYIIDCRRNIRRRDRHPQIVQSVADQGNHNPCDEIPGCLIKDIAMAFERNVPLQRKIDALCQKGTHFIANEISQAVPD